MGIVDHEFSFDVSYSLEDTYSALKDAAQQLALGSYKIDKFDDNLKIAYLKAGVSLFSWGENINVSVKKSATGATVSIISVPKTGVMLGGAMDMGKNRKNINEISQALSNALKKYQLIETDNLSTSPDVADEILKLAKLKDSGILTQEEFDAKKKQLLGI